MAALSQRRCLCKVGTGAFLYGENMSQDSVTRDELRGHGYLHSHSHTVCLAITIGIHFTR